MNLRYTDSSVDDLESSFRWYEIQRCGLGFEFLDCIEVPLADILELPEMHEICYSFLEEVLFEDFHSRFSTLLKRMIL